MTNAVTHVAWGSLIVLACVIGANIWHWLRREREVLAPLPIGLAAIGLYIIPRAAYLLWFDRAPLTSVGLAQPQQVALITRTTLASVVAAVGLVVGHRAHSAIRSGKRIGFSVPVSDPTRVLWIGGGAAVIGSVVATYLLSSLGSLGYALQHQYEISLQLEGKQSLLQLTRLLVVAVTLLLVDPVSGKSRWWVWLVAVGTTLLFLLFGYRALVLLAAGSPVALYHLVVRRLRLSWVLTGATVVGVTLFAMGFVRLLTARQIEKAVATFTKHPVAAVHFAFNAVGEWKVFDATSIIVRDVPEVIPYNFGETFARTPWMIIPRGLWPEKPVTTGRVIVQRYLPNLQTAYPPMAIGELFAAGGWLGVLVGFGGLGWVSRMAWEWHRRRSGSGNASVYLLYCFFVFDFIRVGDPSRTIWFFLIGATMTAFVFAISAPSARPSARASPI